MTENISEVGMQIKNQTLDDIKDNLDKYFVRSLELISEIQEKRVEMENTMANGNFNLSKARYVMGNKNVSPLQYDLPDEAITKVDHSSNDEAIVTFKIKSKHSETETKENSNNLTQRKAFRKPNESNISNDDDSDEKKDNIPVEEADNKLKDPLKWFGVLVPQTLRNSKQCYTKCLHLAVEIASLENEYLVNEKKFCQLELKLKEVK